jgi:hypothetical protein
MYKKLVHESLNEMNFLKRVNNPLGALGIGKRALITNWLNEMGVKYYVINVDLTIDAYKVYLKNKDLKEFPDYIQFNMVTGYFDCSYNRLISLKGCPKMTMINESSFGSFYCNNNKLTSLEGCPSSVAMDFWCSDNKVKFIEDDVRRLCDVKGIILV